MNMRDYRETLGGAILEETKLFELGLEGCVRGRDGVTVQTENLCPYSFLVIINWSDRCCQRTVL